MGLRCYLVRYGSEVESAVLRVIFRRNAEDCAALLGLDLCFDHGCDDRRNGKPHTHVPDRIFDQPRLYPPDDVHRAGLYYRDGELPVVGKIRWELYREDEPPRVLYFEPKLLTV